MHNEVTIICPTCHTEMQCHGVTTKDNLGNDMHVFECPNCHKIKHEILR